MNISKTENVSYIYTYIYVMLLGLISLTLSRYTSLSSIAPGRSSRLHPVSAQSCCKSVLAGRPNFVRLCEGIHKSISLMSLSLLLKQCPACLIRLTRMVFVIGGRWPYSYCFVGCCLQDLFNTAHSIHFVSVHVVQPLIQPLLGRKCVLFYRYGLTSIWPTGYR